MSNWEAGYFHHPTQLKLNGIDLSADSAKPRWTRLFSTPVLEFTLSIGLPVRVLPCAIFLFDMRSDEIET